MSKDYYIINNGSIKRKDNTIYHYDELGNKKALPIEQVDDLHLYGEVDLNTKMINYISRYGIMLHFYNYYGYYSGTYYPRKKNVSGFTLVCQSACYLDLEERLYLAKSFVKSAAHHILRNMRYYKVDESLIEDIKDELYTLDEVEDIATLMGKEGRIRKNYYKSFNQILKNGFEFNKREKRPPKDPLNAMISFGNSIMYTNVLSEIYKTQLDPSISFLHEPSTKRFSLSLDIAEIFKPMIIDPIIFSLVNNKRINKKDFIYEEELCYLSDTGKKKFLQEFEGKMQTTIKHRTLNRKVSYRMFIRLECYKLIKHFIKDEKYKVLKAWW
ncbi:type I-B CRISPR-associated endonuclease Cas1b [Asaccharospora irregularis]|uniref:CRISPR-associated endonuclease Cas1 n=1 Tax=Asaccharospora irregularis DSM 2635 TaxID=1121321 RepID=A0A1M5QDQ9_9FIRM|nr:type I-B CRISPR-associated endonuclease Cas1b [Asaccharospora irregularis]SHH12182.1 CRISPR-associated protein, Cas1 family [Asaccharospora irregularis DSM 2635]